jgi:peptidoglycan/LPS O-acetylase OafA/YrhL
MEGGYGVALFFMISGFILSLPFARYYFTLNGTQQPVSLKRYYARRLTRLEPPYIIALIVFFIAYVFVLQQYSFNGLLPHFFASLIYSHTLIYGEFPWVLPVAWSLEVEVQFYLLAPLLCIVYKIRSRHIRWSIFLVVICASGIFNYHSVHPNIIKFICLFACGMLLTDLYCNRTKFISSARFCFAIGAVAFVAIWFIPAITNFTGYVAKVFLLVVLFYIVLTNDRMKNIFSNRYIAIIGGMCYSIYLLHFGILSLLGKLLQKTSLNLSNAAYIPLYFLLFIIAILSISGTYFLLIEKPFMRLRFGGKILRPNNR